MQIHERKQRENCSKVQKGKEEEGELDERESRKRKAVHQKQSGQSQVVVAAAVLAQASPPLNPKHLLIRFSSTYYYNM